METPAESAPRSREVRLRNASAKDVEAAAELVTRYWEGSNELAVRARVVEELRWLSRAARLGGGLDVIRVGDQVHGVVGWRRDLSDPTRGLVLSLCVEPGDWEAGAFEELLEAAARGLSRAGCVVQDVWLAEASPARFAAEGIGFQRTEARRQLGVLGTDQEAQALEAVHYTRPLDPLPFAPELIRLSWPRSCAVLLLVAPFVFLMLSNATNLLPLTGLALALGVLAPSVAEVWARRRRRAAAWFGVSCTLAAALLGIGWALHVAAFERGGPSALLESRNLFDPALWILGAHWAPLWLAAGLVSARSLRSEQRTEAFLGGSAILFLSLLLGTLLVSPVQDGLALLFGLFCCATPSTWALGAFLGLLFWIADGLRDRRGRRLELNFAAPPQDERA